MNRAPDRQIIATRSWPHPIRGKAGLPPWRPVFAPAMSVDAAIARRHRGEVVTAIGRIIDQQRGTAFVVEQFFAIPRKARRAAR